MYEAGVPTIVTLSSVNVFMEYIHCLNHVNLLGESLKLRYFWLLERCYGRLMSLGCYALCQVVNSDPRFGDSRIPRNVGKSLLFETA